MNNAQYRCGVYILVLKMFRRAKERGELYRRKKKERKSYALQFTFNDSALHPLCTSFSHPLSTPHCHSIATANCAVNSAHSSNGNFIVMVN